MKRFSTWAYRRRIPSTRSCAEREAQLSCAERECNLLLKNHIQTERQQFLFQTKTKCKRNPRSAQSHPRSAQEGMNRSQASSIQGGIRVRLSAVDKVQCVKDIQRLLEAFTSHAIFQPILEYMMSLKEHTWRVQEIPDHVWSWDQ